MGVVSASKPPTKRSKLDRPMPAYLWNPTTWQTDRHIQRMTWAERGLYRELLDESYLRDGLPTDPADIAGLLAEPLATIKPELDVVLECFEVGKDGKLHSSIIEAERARQNEYRRSMVRSSATPNADARGGAQPRTDARNGSGVEVEVEVKAKENLKTKQAHDEAVPDWIPSESWNGFCEMRKRSRKPFTSRAVQLIVEKLEKFRASGENAGEVLDQSTRNGWQDVFPLKQARAGKPFRHASFADTDYSKGLRQNEDGSYAS